MRTQSFVLAALASLLGAAGVALAAAAAHSTAADNARTAALFLIMHAAALLAVSRWARETPGGGALIGGGFLLALATALFSADLASRAFLGDRLFPFAAPIGGSLMIASWLWLAGAFAWMARRG